MNPKLTFNTTLTHAQQGGAFIVMLVIMVLGVSAVMIGTLNIKALHISNDNKNAVVLAQAKEALISYATTSSLPGSLPCPDTAGNGEAATASDCPHYIGYLPWKTLGLPELRDSSGAPLWYALSRNFRKDIANNPINSDSTGTISITGSLATSQAVAVIFAPGPTLNDQSRSNTATALCTTNDTVVSQALCATNFLEGSNANPSLPASPNTQYLSSDVSETFNDQMNFITTENILPGVEKRIAREIKQCLDDYAAQPSLTNPAERINKYPWAAPVSPVGYTSTSNTVFGRVPDAPTITTSTEVPIDSGNASNPKIVALLNALDALEVAVNACLDANNSANRNALDDAGDTLEKAAKKVRDAQPTTPKILSSVTTPAKNAGNDAQDSNRCKNINNGTNDDVQVNLAAANTALGSVTVTINNDPEDASMPTEWPASCILSPPAVSYWPNWKELVFYRVASGYTPNSARTCGGSCLSISGNGNPNQGSGSYRAAVIVAGKNLAQTARVPTNTSSYLEGVNSAVAASTTLETWQNAERATKHINDIVLCVDGKGATQNSKCF